MGQIFTNNASALITNALGTGTTGILVETGKGALFPAPVSPDFAVLTLTNPINETVWEGVRLDSRSGDSLVVTRGYEGAALSWVIGDKIELRITSGFLNEVGYKNIPQLEKTVSYRAVLADAGKCLLHPYSDSVARTFEIPASSSVAYPIGTALTFINQYGAGTITIAVVAGANGDNMRLAGPGTLGSRTLAPNGIATAIKVRYNEWLISGVGLT